MDNQLLEIDIPFLEFNPPVIDFCDMCGFSGKISSVDLSGLVVYMCDKCIRMYRNEDDT